MGLREAMVAALLIWYEMLSIPCVTFARAKRKTKSLVLLYLNPIYLLNISPIGPRSALWDQKII